MIAVKVASRLSVNNVDAAIAAGLAGVGLVRAYSYQVAGSVRESLLHLLLEAYEPAPRPVNLIYAPQTRLPLKLRAFVDFVVPLLRKRLADAALSEISHGTS